MVISKNMTILLLKITKILVKIISYHTHVVDFLKRQYIYKCKFTLQMTENFTENTLNFTDGSFENFETNKNGKS